MSPSIYEGASDEGASDEGASDEGASDERATEGDNPCCPACRTPLFRRHCKFVCPNHGVVVDCSDPFAY